MSETATAPSRACASRVAADDAEAAAWQSYGAAQRLVSLSAEDQAAILRSADPALKGVQDRLRADLVINEIDRDAFLLARRMQIAGEIEFDSDAIVAQGSDNGAFVSGWIWVDYSGTPLDEFSKPADCSDGAGPGGERYARPVGA